MEEWSRDPIDLAAGDHFPRRSNLGVLLPTKYFGPDYEIWKSTKAVGKWPVIANGPVALSEPSALRKLEPSLVNVLLQKKKKKRNEGWVL